MGIPSGISTRVSIILVLQAIDLFIVIGYKHKELYYIEDPLKNQFSYNPINLKEKLRVVNNNIQIN